MARNGPRSADTLLAPVVEQTLAGLTLGGEDAAAAALARRYAATIDRGDEGTLERLGPKLLGVLVELGATPRSRALVQPGPGRETPRVAPGRVRALRAARGAG